MPPNQKLVEKPKPETEKPPLYPSISPSIMLTTATSGYSTMNQRRKEFYSYRNSPKPHQRAISSPKPGGKLTANFSNVETEEKTRRNSGGSEKIVQYYQPASNFYTQQLNGESKPNGRNAAQNGLEYLITQRPFSSSSLRQFVNTQISKTEQRPTVYQSPYGEIVQPRPILLQQQPSPQQHPSIRVHSAETGNRNFRNIPMYLFFHNCLLKLFKLPNKKI